MYWLLFAALAVTGFVACAEFGSYAFVHPVIRRLAPREHLQVEKGLLRTFGRVMPVGMTAAPVLTLIYASVTPGSSVLDVIATVSLFLALATIIAVNVGINARTGRWDIDNPPPNWRALRSRWEIFQGVRSWLLLTGFLLLCADIAVTAL